MLKWRDPNCLPQYSCFVLDPWYQNWPWTVNTSLRQGWALCTFSLFQWWFLLGHHNHQANTHVHQHHVVSMTFRSGFAPAFVHVKSNGRWGNRDRNVVIETTDDAGERVHLLDDLIAFIFSDKDTGRRTEIGRPWFERIPAGLRFVFSSDPAVSSSIFVGEKGENFNYLVQDSTLAVLVWRFFGRCSRSPDEDAALAEEEQCHV